MRQLTSVDAQFLALENARQSGHVGGLAILDPSTAPGGQLELADVQRMIAERLPLLPPMRWRLAEVPFGLDYPYWVDDEDFDLDFHVRELALPPPGTDEKLAEQVARIVSRPLDRARPLWELYLIHGLEHGYVAMLTKIHHATIDGLSGAEIMGVLFDLEPGGRASCPEPRGRRNGGQPERARDARPRALWPAPLPGADAALAADALPNLDETAFGTLPGADTVARVSERLRRTVRGPREGGELERSNVQARRGPRSTAASRRIGASSSAGSSSSAVKAVKNAHGCTVNDVVVSICAGAVRRWLISHTELPADPLVAQIPVSVRTEQQQGTYGNRIMLMSAPLFTNIVDPVDRLQHDPRGAQLDEGAPPGDACRPAPGRQPLHSARRSSPAPPARPPASPPAAAGGRPGTW